MKPKKQWALKTFAKFSELLWDLDRNAEIVENGEDCGTQLPFVKVKGNIGANLSFEGLKSEKSVAYRGIEIREHLYPGDERILVGDLAICAAIFDNENQPKEKPSITVLCGTPKCTTTYQNLVPRKCYEVKGNDSYLSIRHYVDESEAETVEVIDNLFSAINKSKAKEKRQKLSKLKIETKELEQSQDDGRTM